jgi:type IV pilus assembly protein PilQ
MRQLLPLLALLLPAAALAQTPPRADDPGALVAAPLPAQNGAPPGLTVESAFTLGAGDRLDFHARSLDVADVFAELRRLVRRNIVVDPAISARFTGDLYDMSVDEVIAAICRSCGLVARHDAAYVYIEPDRPETRVYELYHARADDVLMLIRPLLSAGGQATATPAPQQGIVSSQDEAGGDDYASTELVIVRDYHSSLEAIDAVVASMDGRPKQVLIEATILSVKLEEGMQFGVEFTALLGQDFEDGGFTSPDGLSLVPGQFDGSQLDDGLANGTTNMFGSFLSGGLSIGYLKDGVAVFVRALQASTDATVLANPHVVTLNKQRGEVLLGRRDGYRTTTTTQTSTTENIEFLETGTRLIFRPFVMGEDLVRLEIHPEDSNGGLNQDGLPFKETAEVTTNVMVRSGQTVVIGGLFRDTRRSLERKVPVLGDLPYVGNLFRSEDDLSRREEIIVVLTPRILSASDTEALALKPQDPATDAAAEAAGLDAPQLSGLDGERIADAYMSLSVALIQRGDYGSAALVLSSLGATQRDRSDVRELRRRVYSLWLPDTTTSQVDRRIFDELLTAP